MRASFKFETFNVGHLLTYVPATLHKRQVQAGNAGPGLQHNRRPCAIFSTSTAHTRSPSHGNCSPALPWPTYATATSLNRMALDATELDHVCQKVAPLVPGRSLQLLSHSHDLSPAITGPALMSSHQGTNFNVLVSDLPRRAMSRVALNSIFFWGWGAPPVCFSVSHQGVLPCTVVLG